MLSSGTGYTSVVYYTVYCKIVAVRKFRKRLELKISNYKDPVKRSTSFVTRRKECT